MATVHIPTGVRQAPPLQPQPQPIVEKENTDDLQPAPQPIAEVPISEKPKKPKKEK